MGKILATLLGLFVIGFFRRLLKRRIDDVAIRYKVQKGIEIVGYAMIILLFLISFTLDNVKDYIIIISLFTAGITFTLQELILSIAGSLYFFSCGSIPRAIVLK